MPAGCRRCRTGPRAEKGVGTEIRRGRSLLRTIAPGPQASNRTSPLCRDGAPSLTLERTSPGGSPVPLLDLFHPPLSRTHPWRGFHGAWAAAMARLLNAGVLPPGFYAVPFLDRGGPFEIDVAALREFEPRGRSARPRPGCPRPLSSRWTSSGPRLRTSAWRLLDEGDPQLAAAVELVSPSTRIGPGARGVRGQVRRVPASRVRAGRRGHGHHPAGRPACGPPRRPARRGRGRRARGLSAVSYRAVGERERGRLLAMAGIAGDRQAAPDAAALDRARPRGAARPGSEPFGRVRRTWASSAS